MILVTGFTPFQSETINPSQQLALTLSRRKGYDCLILPVSFQRSFEVLRQRLEAKEYTGLLMLGQAGGRSKVCLERVALNMEDAEIADEDRVQHLEKVIDPRSPTALLNPLPLRQIVQDMKAQVGPVELSTSAGTYVCNSLYFKTFRWNQAQRRPLNWHLFVHVPYLPEQVLGKTERTPYLCASVQEQVVESLLERLEALPSVDRNEARTS